MATHQNVSKLLGKFLPPRNQPRQPPCFPHEYGLYLTIRQNKFLIPYIASVRYVATTNVQNLVYTNMVSYSFVGGGVCTKFSFQAFFLTPFQGTQRNTKAWEFLPQLLKYLLH